MTNDPLLQVSGLNVMRGAKHVLKDIAFDAGEGRIVGVIGPNGAGKTTLMETIAGRLPYASGSVALSGRRLSDDLNYIRRHVSVAEAPEGASLHLTGERYLEFLVAIEGYAPLNAHQAELCDLLEMGGDLKRPISAYSHGMAKKLALIAALNGLAKIYVFDEIFNGLDVVALKSMKDFMRRFVSGGCTILLCSHFLQILFEWCDEVLLINRGEIAMRWGEEDLSQFGGDYRKFEEQAIQHYG